MKRLTAAHFTQITPTHSSHTPAAVAHDAAVHASEARGIRPHTRLADMAAYEATNRRILYRLWKVTGMGGAIELDEIA